MKPNGIPNDLTDFIAVTAADVGKALVVDAGGKFILSQAPIWQAPTLLNSWVNYEAGTNPAGYTKDLSGVVRLRGMIKDGTGATPAFVLPVGYRPAYQSVFQVITNGSIGRVDIQANGEVQMTSSSAVYLSLDGLSFLPA